jgi:hypothetical protein
MYGWRKVLKCVVEGSWPRGLGGRSDATVMRICEVSVEVVFHRIRKIHVEAHTGGYAAFWRGG